MSRLSILVFASGLFAGCGSTDTVSAEDALIMASIGGEEDAIARSEEAPDDFLPLGRECDASGAFDELFAMYDANASGSLGANEASDARGDWPADPHQMMMIDILHLVYNLDGDGALSESERATLLDDFTVRCDALQAKLIAEFDADGDGALSDAELTTARDTLRARDEEMRAEFESDCQGGPPDGGAPPEAGSEPPPSPLAQEFDADGDGALSDTEHATLVSTVRERLRAGEMPVLPPEGAPPAN